MICVTLAFEDHCGTERATAAVTGNLYVPPARAQYLSFIDRPAHQAYLLAIAAGAAPAGPDVFVEPLADAHTELNTAFDVFIANKRWNAIFAGARNAGSYAHFLLDYTRLRYSGDSFTAVNCLSMLGFFIRPNECDCVPS